MISKITIKSDQLTVLTCDEVEACGREKVRMVLTFLYGEFCVREIHKKFQCEGCEKNWPSQRDHECCLQSEEEIFENGYDEARSRINVRAFQRICRRVTELAHIPMTSEWTTFVSQLIQVSARSMYSFWEEMVHTSDPEEEIIVNFVKMVCDAAENSGEWDQEVFHEFVRFMNK